VYYEKVFRALDYALGAGLISPDANWQIASGEIAIHPYRDRFLDIVKGRTVTFYTNCFVFDGNIAAELAANPKSAVFLSIDAGTPETWRKVKGFDNYDDIVGNLRKYRERGSRAGQIKLKYIVLPGINDGCEDYAAVIGIMKSLGVGCMTLSYDAIHKDTMSEPLNARLIESSGRLAAMLDSAGLGFDFHIRIPRIQQEITAYVSGHAKSDKGATYYE
jgi:wyosine [tRNA(Phe)-imidazoG37] synthetase (radical SAM superfamily)